MYDFISFLLGWGIVYAFVSLANDDGIKREEQTIKNVLISFVIIVLVHLFY